MNTAILKRMMHKFSLESLKSYLGGNLVDTLIEWTPDHEVLFTRTKLSEMILTVYGTNILKNYNFRKELLKTFPEREILSFRQFLKKDDSGLTILTELVDVICAVKWKDNPVSRHFLDLLKIEDDVFTKKHNEEDVRNIIDAYDRFYELLDYQFVVKQRILNNLTSSIELNRMIVHMPTGTGKTKTATHTLCHHYNINLKKRGLIIWIAHTTELLQQAYETFCSVWKHLGDGEVNAYKLWGTHFIDSDTFDYNGVVFCGIQKLMALTTSSPNLVNGLIENCNLIVFDEAHKAAAAETKKVVENFMVRKPGMCDRALVGLTATPGRFTDLNISNQLLATMFGNRLIEIDVDVITKINHSRIEAMNTKPEENIISYFQKNKILAKIKKEQLSYAENLTASEIAKIREAATNNGYTDFTPKALETIGRNKSRNLSIMQKLRQLYSEKIPTIVFACSVEHGQLLSSMLAIEDIPNALVIGAMAATDRSEAIRAFKDRDNPINILINFEVLTTGFDATNIKCVFIARPTQSIVLYSQMIGRGLRGPMMGGNEECLLVDVKDNLVKYNEKLAFAHFDSYWKI